MIGVAVLGDGELDGRADANRLGGRHVVVGLALLDHVRRVELDRDGPHGAVGQGHGARLVAFGFQAQRGSTGGGGDGVILTQPVQLAKPDVGERHHAIDAGWAGGDDPLGPGFGEGGLGAGNSAAGDGVKHLHPNRGRFEGRLQRELQRLRRRFDRDLPGQVVAAGGADYDRIVADGEFEDGEAPLPVRNEGAANRDTRDDLRGGEAKLGPGDRAAIRQGDRPLDRDRNGRDQRDLDRVAGTRGERGPGFDKVVTVLLDAERIVARRHAVQDGGARRIGQGDAAAQTHDSAGDGRGASRLPYQDAHLPGRELRQGAAGADQAAEDREEEKERKDAARGGRSRCQGFGPFGGGGRGVTREWSMAAKA